MTEEWYAPKSVHEQEDVTVLWNPVVHTDREITTNKSDIIIKKKKKKMHAVRCGNIYRHVVQKEATNKLKYMSLFMEIQRMWNLKCKTIPVIIGASGIVTTVSRNIFKAIEGKRSIDSLQKTAVLGTPHIIR
jgi:hypothetical protein